MLGSYKEIVYGVAFGVGAAALDTLIDARATGETFLSELGQHPGMLLYRALFVVFGVLIGGLLWRNNRRERDVRQLTEDMRHFHQEYESRAVVLHTNLQTILTKNLTLSPDAEALVRSAYEKSRELQTLARQRPTL